MTEEKFLSDVSERDKPWDMHRHRSEQVQSLYSGTELDCYAKRINDCSRYLGFALKVSKETGEVSFNLQDARFCRVRFCPVCQWRKSLMWRARFYNAVPRILDFLPDHQFIFLTLTTRNCPIKDLSQVIKKMNLAWNRLANRKYFPAVGWLKSVEVTRNQDVRSEWFNTAHPHFHALLVVPNGYFVGRSYLSQSRWRELWKACLKVDYLPVVNVKAVKAKLGESYDSSLRSALTETLKYSVKPTDLVGGSSSEAPSGHLQLDRDWLVELSHQMKGSRSVSVGGALRKFIREVEPEDLIHPEGIDAEQNSGSSDLWFVWRTQVKRYSTTNLS